MTFNYTDNQLNNLNQDFAVYSVNKEFSDRNKKKFVTAIPKNENETNTITTSDGQEFRVIATNSHGGTGFDGLAVAPIVNGQPDYKSIKYKINYSKKDKRISDVSLERENRKEDRDFLNSHLGKTNKLTNVIHSDGSEGEY